MITENENNYFRFNLKKATNLGKLYLLLSYTKVFAMYLDDRSSPTVEPQLKKFKDSWITIYSL